jgi:hypothetical protein
MGRCAAFRSVLAFLLAFCVGVVVATPAVAGDRVAKPPASATARARGDDSLDAAAASLLFSTFLRYTKVYALTVDSSGSVYAAGYAQKGIPAVHALVVCFVGRLHDHHRIVAVSSAASRRACEPKR